MTVTVTLISEVAYSIGNFVLTQCSYYFEVYQRMDELKEGESMASRHSAVPLYLASNS